MKKFIPLITALIIFTHFQLQAKTRTHAVVGDIGTVVIGNYQVSYERRLDKKTSFAAYVFYYDGIHAIARIFSLGYMGGIGFSPKFHLWGKAHKNSIYLAPSLKLGYLMHPVTKKNPEDHGIMARTGATFGYQHVFKSGFMLDTFVGIEHQQTFSMSKPLTDYEDHNFDLRPVAALSIGYAFK